VVGYDFATCLGDEEYVNILPPAQWLSSYVFFTDPTYTTTNLVITRKGGTAGFQDVTVDCLGVISGWQPVGTNGDYEITNVDLQRNTPVGTCTNGRHTASSAGSFNIMVWGLSKFASYAYPAGGNVGKINPVIVIGRQQ
ncbi:MAG TPA: IgGFc-binding protein, partial [Kofleriaceae bacterium]